MKQAILTRRLTRRQDTQHHSIYRIDTKHNDIQYNDTQHCGLICDTPHK
jgi:hypothetical protein